MARYQLSMKETEQKYEDGCEYEVMLPNGKVVASISITEGSLDFWDAETGTMINLFNVDELGRVSTELDLTKGELVS